MPRSFLIKKKKGSKRNSRNQEWKSVADENTPTSAGTNSRLVHSLRPAPCKNILDPNTQRPSVLTHINDTTPNRVASVLTPVKDATNPRRVTLKYDLDNSERLLYAQEGALLHADDVYLSRDGTGESPCCEQIDVGMDDVIDPVTPIRDVISARLDVHDVSIEIPRREQSGTWDSSSDVPSAFESLFPRLPETTLTEERYSPISPYQPEMKQIVRTPSPAEHVTNLSLVLESRPSPMFPMHVIDNYSYPDERKENVMTPPNYTVSPLTSPPGIFYRKWNSLPLCNSGIGVNDVTWQNHDNATSPGFYAPTVPIELPVISQLNCAQNGSEPRPHSLGYGKVMDAPNHVVSHMTSLSHLATINLSPSYLSHNSATYSEYKDTPGNYVSELGPLHAKQPLTNIHYDRRNLNIGERLISAFDGDGDKKKKTKENGPPLYKCDHCGKSYSTLSGVTKHKQFHCTSHIKKEFRCKFCDKMYTSLGALKMHIRTHTLPCKCHICGKAFSRPWLLQGHVRTHTGEKPFQCLHCGRSFADRSNLRAHLQTHSDVKKYSCKNCAKTFSRMSLLVKHEDGGCSGYEENMDICVM